MLGEKALELVKELHRSRGGTLPPFSVNDYVHYEIFGSG